MRQKGSSTPASMAEATAAGMRSASRPSAGINPVSTIISPAMTKAPTAVDQPRPSVEAASRAAPGVDQARTTGIFSRQLSTAPGRPMPRHRAVTMEMIWAGAAPMAWPACTTRATVPPKPTTVATAAAEKLAGGGRRMELMRSS